MQQARQGTEAALRANDFFRFCSVESLVQLAMLADGAAEALEIVRFHDTEAFDLSQTPGMLSRFLHRCDTLFVRGESPHVGHCKSMLRLLEVERSCIVDKCMKTIGGPGSVRPEIIQRCLQRMAAWVHLAASRLDLEFPAWRPLAYFEVFNLQDALSAASKGESTTQAAKIKLDRIAEIFQLDSTLLLEQYIHLRTNALHTLETGKCSSSLEAWKVARRHADDRRLRNKYDFSVIDQVLSRFMVFCGNTTSGVEQTFSSTARCIGDYRRKMLPDAQNLLFRVLLTPCSAGVINVAAELYGEFRSEKQNQRWKRPRLLKDTEGQEATYIRKRKRAVDEMCDHHPARDPETLKAAAKAAADDAWGHGHEGELSKLKKQERDVLLDHVNRELIPEDVVDLEMLADAIVRDKKQKKNAEASFKALHRCARGRDRPALHIDPSKVQLIGDEPPSTAADFYVVDRLELADKSLLYLASLFGKVIVNPEYILSDGARGSAMAFRSAVAVKRQVWVASCFRAQHPEEAALMDEALVQPHAKMKYIGEVDFLTKMQRCNGVAKGFTLIGLVSEALKEDPFRICYTVKAVYTPVYIYSLLGLLRFIAGFAQPCTLIARTMLYGRRRTMCSMCTNSGNSFQCSIPVAARMAAMHGQSRQGQEGLCHHDKFEPPMPLRLKALRRANLPCVEGWEQRA